MHVKNLIVIVLTVLTLTAQAQTGSTEDVLYLKNEAVVRGKIISRNDSRVKIQTADGSVWVFSNADIEKIASEKPFHQFQNSGRGYMNYTELGPLVAGKTTIDGVTTAAFSFQTVNGYQFKQWLFTGAGAGVDLYATQTILPLFASVRGDLSGSYSVIPFYFADAGYGVNITQNSANNTDFSGGLLYAAGLGVKIPFNKSAGFLISFGYRHQSTSYKLNSTETKVQYTRLAIRAGFFF
jgi:hypothetical protein